MISMTGGNLEMPDWYTGKAPGSSLTASARMARI